VWLSDFGSERLASHSSLQHGGPAGPLPMTGRRGVSLGDAGLAVPGRASGTARCLRLAGAVRNSVPRWRKGWDSNPR
jgi:hypothetical protein